MEMIMTALHSAKVQVDTTTSHSPVMNMQGENGTPFLQVLAAAIGYDTESETAGQSELTEALLTGAVPANVLLMLLSQLEQTDLKEALSRMLSALENSSPETRSLILSHPAMAAWVQEANLWLDQQAESKLVLTQSQSQLPMTAETEAQHTVMRLMQLLASGQSSEEGNSIAAKLQQVVQELARTVPGFSAQSASLTAANESPLDTRTFGNGKAGAEPLAANPAGQQQDLSRNASHKQGGDTETVRQTLLERLSFMKSPVHIVNSVHEQGRSAEQTLSTWKSQADATGLAAIASNAADAEESIPVHLLQGLSMRGPIGQEAKQPVQTAMQAQYLPAEMTKFIVKNMTITQLGGMSEAKISLVPEHLGQLDVKISVQNGMITASFMAETAVAREMLENQLPQLRSALQQQGLQVERLIVSHHQSQGSSMFHDGRQQQTGSEQQQRNEKRSAMKQIDDIDFLREMEEAFLSGDVRYGSTFHATA